jgi:hypothetical protein
MVDTGLCMIMCEYLTGCNGSREQCGRSLDRLLHALRESVSLSGDPEDWQPVKHPSLGQRNQYLRFWPCMYASQQTSSRGTIDGLGGGLSKVDGVAYE